MFIEDVPVRKCQFTEPRVDLDFVMFISHGIATSGEQHNVESEAVGLSFLRDNV